MTGLAVSADLPSPLLVLLVLPVLFLIPGYLLCLAVYPCAKELPHGSRIPLSIVASACLVGLVAFGLAESPLLLTKFTLFGVLLVVILSLTILAEMRRIRAIGEGCVPVAGVINRARREGSLPLPHFSLPMMLLSTALAFALITAVFAVVIHPVNEGYTEFFLHQPADDPDLTGDMVQIEIRNHEAGDQVYEIEYYLINRTEPILNRNAILPENRFAPSTIVTVRQDEIAIRNLSLAGTGEINGDLVLLLFRSPAPSEQVQGSARINASYRNLTLVLRGQEPPMEEPAPL